ncbi:MAG: cytochrome b/b6 domain-containing protein [Halobacteriota archaeon]|nr:cytochrome b/b6 domain-containing protein [Halobacteriota archaeon]
MTEPLIKDGKVKKFSTIVMIEHWLFTIVILGLLINGLLPFLNRFFREALDIRGAIRFPEVGLRYHEPLGILLIVLCMLHLLVHLVIFPGNKAILPTHPKNDLRNSFHAVLYFFLLTKKPERGNGERYRGNQKIEYMAYVFTLGLLIPSGIIMYAQGQTMEGFMSSPLKLTHAFGALMLFIVVLWHFGIAIRKRDWTALKGIYLTGKVPLWHVRKNNKIWYDEITQGHLDEHKVTPLAHSLMNISGGALHPETAEAMAKELKSSGNEKVLEKVTELEKA